MKVQNLTTDWADPWFFGDESSLEGFLLLDTRASLERRPIASIAAHSDPSTSTSLNWRRGSDSASGVLDEVIVCGRRRIGSRVSATEGAGGLAGSGGEGGGEGRGSGFRGENARRRSIRRRTALLAGVISRTNELSSDSADII